MLGVFDDATGLPLTSAEVVDLSTGTKALTSISGAVSLAFLRQGTTMLQVRKIGYAGKMVPVVVSATDTVSITVLLKPLEQTLPEVVTKASPPSTGKLAAFEIHRAAGFGHFMAREQLEKWDNRRTSDMLRLVPGLKLINDPRDRRLFYVGTSRGTASFLRNGPDGLCLAAVMVDGHLTYSGVEGQERFDINSIPPEHMAALEYYGGGASMPIEYNSTRANCGLVVIWTR